MKELFSRYVFVSRSDDGAVAARLRLPLSGKGARCEACGRGVVRRRDYGTAYGVVDEVGGRPFGDYLGYPDLIWSGRAVNAMQDAGFSGFAAHRISLMEVRSQQEIDNGMDYYAIEVLGRVEIDREIFDRFEGEVCPVCKHWQPKKGGRFGWGTRDCAVVAGDSDLATISNVKIGGVMCTRQVVDLVRNAGLSGFTFRPPGRGLGLIDHRDEEWWERLCQAVARKYPGTSDVCPMAASRPSGELLRPHAAPSDDDPLSEMHETMKLTDLVGLSLTDPAVLELLNDLQIDVQYDMERARHGMDDGFWAISKEKGFNLGFDHEKRLKNIFLHHHGTDGYSPPDPEFSGVEPASGVAHARKIARRDNVRTREGKARRGEGRWIKLFYSDFSVHYEFLGDVLRLITIREEPEPEA